MKRFFILTFIVLAGVFAYAQSTDNEDEVVKIEWYNQHATKEGELIVKFADNTPMLLKNNDKGALQTTGMQRVDVLLQQYPVARAERLCPNDDPNRELKVSKSYNGPDVVERDLSRLCRFVMEDPTQTHQMIQALNELEEVEFAEPNYMAFALGTESEAMSPICPIKEKGTPKPGSYFNPEAYMAEPMYSLQWGLEAVHLPELWAADENTNTDRAIIAILDTGVDIDHPDLAANIWTNPGETNNGYDDDNNGFTDDIHGWDFVNQTADMHDWNSHGTHCAGIAAAVGDNGIGITGANPKALIMPIVVLQSNGTGDIATIIQGINYAKNNGANVLSMSFGSYSNSIALEQALGQAYQNAVLVAAAGNEGAHIDPRCCGHITCGPMFPGAYSFVLGIQATQQIGGLAIFSNSDCDGPSYSQYSEEQLFNYELSAPGVSIYSTVPNGNYRSYNGTSMATPLVAGGVSALLHAKSYLSQEMLWGDLINTSPEFGHVNFKACYDAGEAPAQLQFVTFKTIDTINGDGDGRPDAGETICLYPTLRTAWGSTNDIVFWLTLSEFENPDIVTFLDTEPVEFGWSLSAYAKSKSANPVRFTINPDCVDGRFINMELHATASNDPNELVAPFTIQVENGVELCGMITHDMTLDPNVHYIVTSTVAIPENVTLTIMPGTTLKFHDYSGISCAGHINCVGTPENQIKFMPAMGHMGYSIGFHFPETDTIKYTQLDGFVYYNFNYYGLLHGCYKNCLITNSLDVASGGMYPYIFYGSHFINCNLTNNDIHCGWGASMVESSNIINNQGDYIYFGDPSAFCVGASDCNLMNYKCINIYSGECGSFNGRDVFWASLSLDPVIIHTENPNYFGSSVESIVREGIWDIHNGVSFCEYDLSNMRTSPNPATHGVVWKVEVNGYDAQDEYDQLPPLGCGTHEFKVYFNRPMNTSVTPMLTMGVRPPYTQHAIADNGHWNTDGTIYTAFLTIDGTTVTDGLNRIYVANAEDTEHFVIPIENFRFNVQVSSAGSLSADFMATPGIGKVDLEWNNNEVDFEDFLGYNMYRYRYDSVYIEGHYDENWNWIEPETFWMPTDSLQLNTLLIQDTLFVDYDVTPGERYYYYYKVLRTGLTESDASLTVTTVPLTATKGDANGSLSVDVADVVTIVSYLTNGNPQPFIYEAADANSDGEINILDIVAVINLIINRGELPDKDPIATAYYTIEDGILLVDTPVELGGVQVSLEETEGIEPLQSLDGFEQVNTGTIFLAYSMSGKRLEPGKHALLRIGSAQITNIALSDPEGHNVLAIESFNGLDETETLFMSQPYPNPFNNSLTIPYIIGDERAENVSFTITNIMGQMITRIELGEKSRGEYQYDWAPNGNMASGIYTVIMDVDGRKVQQSKVVYVK